MFRLDDYRTALLAVNADVSDEDLAVALDAKGPAFPGFVIDHGLGPMWHERTGRKSFYASRMQAEALFAMHEQALGDVEHVLTGAGIDYAIIKGAANRLLLYSNPAVRTCHDIDVLVRPDDRLKAARAMADIRYAPMPEHGSISRELIMRRGAVDLDLHWGLLREGRLREDLTAQMLGRKRWVNGVWMLSPDDALFLLLVHPAFAKHLAGWEMGMHRVADLVTWLRDQPYDWNEVLEMLRAAGVRTAAWATLRWVQTLIEEYALPNLQEMLSDAQPSRARREWIDFWLRHDLPARMSGFRWARLLGFSMFLHDTPGDALRAARGQWKARKRSVADIEAFRRLLDQELVR